MSAHTPGPWVAVEWGGDTCLVEAHTPDGKKHVLEVVITKANLTLIAAAPDLLAALERTVGYLRHSGECPRLRSKLASCDCAIGQALAAITKARGGK